MTNNEYLRSILGQIINPDSQPTDDMSSNEALRRIHAELQNIAANPPDIGGGDGGLTSVFLTTFDNPTSRVSAGAYDELDLQVGSLVREYSQTRQAIWQYVGGDTTDSASWRPIGPVTMTLPQDFVVADSTTGTQISDWLVPTGISGTIWTFEAILIYRRGGGGGLFWPSGVSASDMVTIGAHGSGWVQSSTSEESSNSVGGRGYNVIAGGKLLIGPNMSLNDTAPIHIWGSLTETETVMNLMFSQASADPAGDTIVAGSLARFWMPKPA